jgi:hypothetical protein
MKGITAGIVVAYVSRQPVAAPDLPGLMRQVHDGLPAPPGARRSCRHFDSGRAGDRTPDARPGSQVDPKRGPDQLHRRQAVQGLRAPPHKYELRRERAASATA